MKIKYYGVRGSLPVSGQEFVKYGGDTTCVVLYEGNTTIIVDSGSGIRNFGRDIIKDTGPTGHKFNLFFTHYHWDHLMGFPFFSLAYIKTNELNVYGETKYNMTVMDILKKQQQFINFPVELSGMAAKFIFNELQGSEEIKIGPFKISYIKINHPGGSIAYRIESGNSSFVVATDYEHFSVPDANLIKLAKDANVLMYDSQYTPEEYPKFVGWGHSTYEEGIKIAQLADVKNLHLIHHAPEHTDDDLDKIQIAATAKFPSSIVVKQGFEMQI
ncbi:MAG: MBL fold metallo-hydrolase [Candidatus Goldbacteria bacterium]|nr:MBL fold metallo-hydrolase [Candidatus Goldiibacteriota bacterium]